MQRPFRRLDASGQSRSDAPAPQPYRPSCCRLQDATSDRHERHAVPDGMVYSKRDHGSHPTWLNIGGSRSGRRTREVGGGVTKTTLASHRALVDERHIWRGPKRFPSLVERWYIEGGTTGRHPPPTSLVVAPKVYSESLQTMPSCSAHGPSKAE